MPIKEVKYIVFRRLTTAEFFHINKPIGTEIKGGGQSYIDFPTADVSPAEWKVYFAGLKASSGAQGPNWTFPINSIGITTAKQQLLTIGQRRAQSFNIRAQKIASTKSNRVLSWHPSNGFPAPKDPSKSEHIDNLVVYIARTADGEFWAGWYKGNPPYADAKCAIILQSMINTNTSGGFIEVTPNGLFLDTADKLKPFSISKAVPVSVVKTPPAKYEAETEPKQPVKKAKAEYKPWDDEKLLQELFAEDENYDPNLDEKSKKRIQEVRTRNTKAAKIIKGLYLGECQISGDDFAFKKKNGETYAEVHHLIPLNEGGADSPFNLIVVNPLIHKMLHYADVTGIDLSLIKDNKLDITINGKPYTIKWRPEHFKLVELQQVAKS